MVENNLTVEGSILAAEEQKMDIDDKSKTMKRNIRGVYCHRLRRKIGPNHPWYFNEVKKRRKINPKVWIAMGERLAIESVAAENLKILQAKAPKSFNGTVLDYFTYDYTESEKAILPKICQY